MDRIDVTRLAWLKLLFLRHYRNMGLRVFLYALLSLIATLISPYVNGLGLFDWGGEAKFDFSSVTPVLTILASSMLAVSTFSLNIMVTAYRAAAAAATPRIHRILLEDTTSQSVLAAFIGAFVYSLGSIVLYRLGFYPPDSALTVMAVTTGVVVLVVISLLRWINHLTTLGSLEDSLRLACERASDVLQSQARNPRSGASALTHEPDGEADMACLPAPVSGFVQFIDMAALEDDLPDNTVIYLSVCPGTHVVKGQTIARSTGTFDDDTKEQLLEAFRFGPYRTHEQDTEFGLEILSEIASKALSPGVNDPATAVQVLAALKSLLWAFGLTQEDEHAVKTPRVFAPFPGPEDLMEAAFAPIMRFGAGEFDVACALRKTLAILATSENSDLAAASRELADRAISHSRLTDMMERDLKVLEEIPLPPPCSAA